jgi:tRNA(fMet)-specific endonuclease VapC
MAYLVDSNIVVDHLLDVSTASALLEQLALEGIAISIVTYMEAFQGVEQSRDQEGAREKFHAFLAGVLILPLSFAVAERCARLRKTLKSQNKRVNSRALDLIIAATALEYSLTLVTNNTGDFKDIPDLPLHQPRERVL